MTTSSTWPDRDTYVAAVRNAASCFDLPELQSAQFFVSRMGGPLVWSGGRAIVFHATCPSGRGAAIRFLMSDDRDAEARYRALGRHLDARHLPPFVRADWVAGGLRLGQHRYPVLVMDWVDGKTLDRFLDDTFEAPSARGEFMQLASAWQRCCTSLSTADVGHGDIHAGNILVTTDPGGRLQLRLIDYDNVSLPGLDVTSHEDGNPAFQHPARNPDATGNCIDALGNTLTYLSLRCLADDPRFWQTFYRGDDRLLFCQEDLADTSREVWAMLRSSSDATVRSIADLTCLWLRAGPHRYESLDQIIAAAAEGNRSSNGVLHNEWIPHPPPPRQPDRQAGPQHTAEPIRQQWPRPVPRPPASRDSHALAWIIALLVVIVVVYQLAH